MIPASPLMFTTLTLKRYVAGAYTNGRWAAGTATQSTIVASIQPVTSSELERLPEGLRTKGVRKVYTEIPLQTANEKTGIAADRIIYDSEDWEVQEIDAHVLGIRHFKAICVRVER